MTTLEIIEEIKKGKTDLIAYVTSLCDRIASEDSKILAMVPGTWDRERVISEASRLLEQYPELEERPPLFGIPVGIKDIIRTSGFPTRCGSKLPENFFDGPEADCVKRIKNAGGLVMGKTVTTEFAYFEPGPTRNPHNLNHSPGGSSSGSAAGVASGFFPYALGSQTGGSVIRPAAYCGVVGFKPSFGKIPMEGVMPLSESLDHLGIFCEDPTGIDPLMGVIGRNWNSETVRRDPGNPVLGVPDGPYLHLATPHGLQYFEETVEKIRKKGLEIRRVKALGNIEEMNDHLLRLMWVEIADSHAAWFEKYGHLYSEKMTDAVKQGQAVSDEEHERFMAEALAFRRSMEDLMASEGIDAWICPATTDSAPEGFDSTGSPIMNFPWTYGGLPAITLPVGKDDLGLPQGLQVVGGFGQDEVLVARAQLIHNALSS